MFSFCQKWKQKTIVRCDECRNNGGHAAAPSAAPQPLSHLIHSSRTMVHKHIIGRIRPPGKARFCLALVCGRNATAEAKLQFFFFACFAPSR
jgi:hypothetical protein